MWPFSRTNCKDVLQGKKFVRVNGLRFTIRKLNPLIDFESSKMPQIFTMFQSRRKTPQDQEVNQERVLKDMMAIVEAGLIKPELVPVAKTNEGVTVEDLFRDMDTGVKLYWEILAHSLNRFRGIRGFFLLMKIRYTLYMQWRQNTESDQVKSSSPTTN